MMTTYVMLALAMIATLGGILGRIAGFILMMMFALAAFIEGRASRNMDVDALADQVGSALIDAAFTEETN